MGTRPAEVEESTVHPEGWRLLIGRLYRHARWLGASPEAADDLVQEATLRHARDPSWYDSTRGSLETLLRVFIQSRHQDRRRQVATRSRLHGRFTLVATAPAPDHGMVADDAGRARARLYAALEPGHQEVFGAWIRQREGERAHHLAAELGGSVGAFEAAKKRLRRRLQQLLTELDLTPADLTSDGGTR